MDFETWWEKQHDRWSVHKLIAERAWRAAQESHSEFQIEVLKKLDSIEKHLRLDRWKEHRE